MSTEKIEKLFQRIAHTINNMIPDKWNKLYLYAEVLQDSTCVYFDFESATKNRFVYSLDIPEEYNIDEDKFTKLKRDLVGIFEELNHEFKLNTPQPWTNITMYLESTGKFKMDYNYDEVKLPPHKQRVVWEYKTLGVYPTNDFDKKIIDAYIKDNGDRPK
jgi:uncharacterized protein (TIGR01741 family)